MMFNKRNAKALLVFPKWLGRSGDYCHAAAQRVGLESHLAWGNDLDETGFAGSLRSKARRAPVLSGPFRRRESDRINEGIIDKARRLKPDIVINNCPALRPGTVEELRKNSGVMVYWAGDDPELFPALMETIDLYDIFLAASPEWLGNRVSPRRGASHYLPYGFEPDVFHPARLSPGQRDLYASPITFVGARYSDRELLLNTVRDMGLAIWGWKKDNALRRVYRNLRGSRHSAFHGKYRTDSELYIKALNCLIRGGSIGNRVANMIYNASSIVLNLQHPQIIGAVNPKTFEIAGAGGFQLLQHSGDLLGLYEKDKEVVCFASASDLRDKVAYYLENEGERVAIAQRARKRTLGEHTFTHRMSAILSFIG